MTLNVNGLSITYQSGTGVSGYDLTHKRGFGEASIYPESYPTEYSILLSVEEMIGKVLVLDRGKLLLFDFDGRLTKEFQLV
jgi:hypothetical protein